MEALEKHQEECNGSHFLASSRASTHRMRSSRRSSHGRSGRRGSGSGRRDDSGSSDDEEDYTINTTGEDMPDMPNKKGDDSQDSGSKTVVPWSVRLEKIGDDLRNANTVVKVHRFGKRLLRKSFRGNDAITWLLGN